MVIDFIKGQGGGGTGTTDTTARNMATAAQNTANSAKTTAESAMTVANSAMTVAETAQASIPTKLTDLTNDGAFCKIVTLTQAEYDALSGYDENTLYNIQG